MSAFCRAALRPRPEPLTAPGYTLLELLIVLAIIGLMVGMATPAFLRMLDQQRRFTSLQEIEQGLSLLAIDARTAGRDTVHRASGSEQVEESPPNWLSPLADPVVAPPFPAPQGWSVEFEKDLWIRSDGVCSGGQVLVRQGNEKPRRYNLAAPFCNPEIMP